MIFPGTLLTITPKKTVYYFSPILMSFFKISNTICIFLNENTDSNVSKDAVDCVFSSVYDINVSGRLGDRGSALTGSRKVRTP